MCRQVCNALFSIGKKRASAPGCEHLPRLLAIFSWIPLDSPHQERFSHGFYSMVGEREVQHDCSAADKEEVNLVTWARR